MKPRGSGLRFSESFKRHALGFLKRHPYSRKKYTQSLRAAFPRRSVSAVFESLHSCSTQTHPGRVVEHTHIAKLPVRWTRRVFNPAHERALVAMRSTRMSRLTLRTRHGLRIICCAWPAHPSGLSVSKPRPTQLTVCPAPEFVTSGRVTRQMKGNEH